MKGLSRILVYEGFALVAFGVLSFFFASEAMIFSLFLLAAGLVCLLAFLIFGGSSIKERLFSKGTRYGTNAFVYSIVILALLGTANYLGANHVKEWDMTSTKVNSLADQTVKVLDSLDTPVKVIAFFKAVESSQLKDLLERYARKSDTFEFEIVDPDLRPELVKKYQVTERGQIVIESGARSTIISSPTEQDLTNAIIKVSKQQSGAVYFLKGHGEVSLESKEARGFFGVKLNLENENYVIRDLLLETMPAVPADCKTLVIAGPKKQIGQREIGAIKSYLDSGGHALILLDPQTATGLEPLVSQYGVDIKNDIVVDQQVRLFEGATLGIDPIAQDFPDHEITKNFTEPVVFPQSRSLKLETDNPAIQVTALANTGESSWSESDLERLFSQGEVGLDEKDTKGPVTIAAAVVKKLSGEDGSKSDQIKAQKEMRLVVVGDSDFASNQYLNYMYNGALFLNMVHWLSGEDYLVAIAPKSYAPSNVHLTPRDRQLVFLASVFLVPQLVLMFGIGRIIRRRGK